MLVDVIYHCTQKHRGWRGCMHCALYTCFLSRELCHAWKKATLSSLPPQDVFVSPNAEPRVSSVIVIIYDTISWIRSIELYTCKAWIKLFVAFIMLVSICKVTRVMVGVYWSSWHTQLVCIGACKRYGYWFTVACTVQNKLNVTLFCERMQLFGQIKPLCIATFPSAQ